MCAKLSSAGPVQLPAMSVRHPFIVTEVMQPRTSSSITNRHSLRKALGLNSYVARLKQQTPDQPLPPVLLLWVE